MIGMVPPPRATTPRATSPAPGPSGPLHIMGDAYGWHVVRVAGVLATGERVYFASCPTIAAAEAARRLLGGAL